MQHVGTAIIMLPRSLPNRYEKTPGSGTAPEGAHVGGMIVPIVA
jgi:hypothetical protein